MAWIVHGRITLRWAAAWERDESLAAVAFRSDVPADLAREAREALAIEPQVNPISMTGISPRWALTEGVL